MATKKLHVLLSTILILPILHFDISQSACGGYMQNVKDGQTFTIISPNYPNNYPLYTKCVWLFHSDQYIGWTVSVGPVQGEISASGTCLDYVQFRDWTGTGNLLKTLCDTNTTTTFTTDSPLLWIKFYSNHQFVKKGFQATLTATRLSYNNWGNYTNYTKSCHLTTYTCPNKECVYQGNLCDGTNDCGCDDYTCDETICWEFDLLKSVGTGWGIGIAMGFGVSLLMFICFGMIEMREDRKPACLRTQGGSNHGCCPCLSQFKKNKVNMGKKDDMAVQKIIQSLNQGKHPLRWDSSSESDFSQNTSRRTSMSGSLGGSRRSSTYQAPTNYGNTLSPKDATGHGRSPPATGNRTANNISGSGGLTLTVPKISHA